jgi:hypothetical protein
MAISSEEQNAGTEAPKLPQVVTLSIPSVESIRKIVAALVFSGFGSYLFQVAPTTEIAWVCCILLLTIYLFVFEIVGVDVGVGADPAVFALTVALATSNSFLIPTPSGQRADYGPGRLPGGGFHAGRRNYDNPVSGRTHFGDEPCFLTRKS